MTGFDSKVLRNEPEGYRINFYTDSKEAYELVQAACRMCIDAKNQKLREQPEVVRCKDCVHAWHTCDRDLRCEHFGTYETDPIVSPEGFCSWGERRCRNETRNSH